MLKNRGPARNPLMRIPILSVYRTDTGKKYAMAISGVVLLGFILGHMIGNLHVFEGAHGGEYRIDEYGEELRELGIQFFPRTLVLWAFIRIPLAVAFLIHIHSAYSLTRSNRAARQTRYQSPRNYLAADYASRTMRWSGIIVLLFLAWHLADLTIGVEAVNPDFVRGSVYHNLVSSLSRWPVWVLYVAAQLALAFHVWHGAWSLFQSLGLNHPRFNQFRPLFAHTFAVVVTGGFLAVPVAIALGIVA
ncbi:MAG: succinate dehydrogenase cytochrome b subunit [Acidimicrobiia bacterium]|nr:succinate dehydrogenase cytochrome b subunit [bacterium]MCY3579526.1 succinate dehydrogenase cytochrome b subunit [bacterium]MDE0644476.1 succinate dehydrogenase cytochrome b subunit [bacterium]MXZ07001.1 succinate dehydrogenase cytochrome b subunit [Acidimicrobiia bacterium]MYD05300.1 succinate dehydrogenase cytochrome b subunit [Acidimicrobiia bacterium]